MTSSDPINEPVVIIGAGPAGLACAAALRAKGIASVVFEKENHIASVWRHHYDRLHLHTHRLFSGLPGLAMPGSYPKYPSRLQVIEYLESYAKFHDIEPRLDCEVTSVTHADGWRVDTAKGTIHASHVVVATGIASNPNRPSWPGMEQFGGEILHSSAYKNPDGFHNKRVLVVGFGNSGGEIAIDLADQGVQTSLSVRGAVNVVPRDILGLPILAITIAQKYIPYKIADLLNGPILRLVVGDIEKLGLRKASKGPMAQVVEDGKIPLLDIGTLDRIRRGLVSIKPGIRQIGEKNVMFEDGSEDTFDAIVLATGFNPDLRHLVPNEARFLDADGVPTSSGPQSGGKGLYFCSFVASPTGQLRQIGIEAKQIAKAIAVERNAP